MSDIKMCCNCKSIYYKATKVCSQCYGKTFQETDESNRPFIKWICTDADTFQFGRQVGDKVFEFKEYNRFKGTALNLDNAIQDLENWETMTIDLEKYTDTEIDNLTDAYYGSILEIIDIYGEEAEWIIAECIFEQKSGLY